jgi:outer membrane lipopolysaccharide assembly protein LptE/RlpB
MRDEGGIMTDERRGTRDEGCRNNASIVHARKASGHPSFIVFFLLALLLLLSSCGYRFTSVGGLVPEDTKTIAIPAFINDTAEPYVDVEMTKAVVNEFLTDGRLKVVSAETADLVLKGKVTKFVMTPSAYTIDNYVQAYTVSIGLNVTVEDVKTHKTLLQDTGIGSVFNASYGVSSVTSNGASTVDITATKIAKETALKRACRDVASTIRSRLLEGF